MRITGSNSNGSPTSRISQPGLEVALHAALICKIQVDGGEIRLPKEKYFTILKKLYEAERPFLKGTLDVEGKEVVLRLSDQKP